MGNRLNDNLIFTDSDNKEKAVLGTLEGPCADIIHGTRNGRHYSESLWERVFNSSIFKEMIKNGGIPGELDHPTDREETDSSRIAVILRETPKKKNGLLWAKFDILNTPLGKIAYTLAKAGFKLGISSRGSGEVIPGYDGTEEVDESTYEFKAFDLVLLPAVESARLNLVTEGLSNKKSFNYKEALLESIESANEEDRELMKETLSNLNISFEEASELCESKESIEKAMDTLHDYLVKWYDNNIAPETVKDANQAGWDDEVNDAWVLLTNLVTRMNRSNLDPKDRDYIDEVSEEMPVDDTKGKLEELQAALKENNELSSTITKLQEKLSVSYAKEAELQKEVDRYFRSIKKLSEECKQLEPLKSKIISMNEELSLRENKLDKANKTMKTLRTNLKEQNNRVNSFKESNNEKEIKISQLNENVKSLKTKQKLTESQFTEKVNDLQNTLDMKTSEYSKKLSQANKLIENYKTVANKAVDKYIDSQARMLGISKQEIKNRLSESYSFDEIDSVCEELREYKLNISKLNFRTSPLTEEMKFKATSSKKESILPADRFNADEVDDQLMTLAGL